MLELKISNEGCSIDEVSDLIRYIAGMLEVGILNGVLKDNVGNEICEWGYK